MTPEEKKSLVTARLAEQLRSMVPQLGSHTDGIARDMMDGVQGKLGLWAVMAPLIESLGVRETIENTLENYEGMPLTESVVREIMTAVERVLEGSSGVESWQDRRRRDSVSRRHSSSALWGGRQGIEGGDSGRGDAVGYSEGTVV